MKYPPPHPPVAAIFAAAAPATRHGMLALRGLIFRTAQLTPGVGPLTETLRWGQPAYLTLATGSGCSLRIGPTGKGFALFVHCRTTLIQDFQAGPGAGFRTMGTRAVLFHSTDEVDSGPISGLIHGALTWHLRARDRRAI